MIIYGINPVLEALRAGRVKALRISSRDDDRMRELLAFASTHGITPERVTNDVLARQAKGGVHQGVVADVDAASQYDVEDLVHSARAEPLILVLDGIEDPHNLGAILRSADATGVDGVIVQARGDRRVARERGHQREPGREDRDAAGRVAKLRVWLQSALTAMQSNFCRLSTVQAPRASRRLAKPSKRTR